MVTMDSAYQREYYKKNKIKYSTTYNPTKVCECCDFITTKKYFIRHTKTKKHIKNMNNESLKEIDMEEVSDAVKQKRIEVKVLLNQIKQLESK
jgi:hypothetical protein